MPVICWGALGKAANDSITIDEEINAYIRAHDANVNAHGLSGYAVYIHRTDVVIDHVDYSVTTDKISADQIVGKDFRTAPGVGPGQDGVLFNPQGIMMYQGGGRKVNIPVTGDPEFRGKLAAEEIRYLNYFFNTFFEVIDPWVGDLWGWQYTGSGGIAGRAFRTSSIAGQTYGTRFFTTWPDITKNPFFELTSTISTAVSGHVYFGFGAYYEDPDNTTSLGFGKIKGQMYARINNGESYAFHMPGVKVNGRNIYRCELDSDLAKIRWFINGHLYVQIDDPGFNNPGEASFGMRIWNTVAGNVKIWCHGLSGGEDI